MTNDFFSIEIIVGVLVAAIVAYVIYQAVVGDKEPAEAPKAVKEKAPAKKVTKKKATKKAAKVDLDSMSKNDLLAHAKANGVKANASMNKAAILAAIKG